MKLISYTNPGSKGAEPAGGEPRLGVFDPRRGVFDVAAAAPELPATMLDFIAAGEAATTALRQALQRSGDSSANWSSADSVRLLAPIPLPRKNVFCVGRNYKLHIIEGAVARGVEPTYPKVPEFFSKPPTAVVGHDAAVELHERVTKMLDYEVELAIVIGRKVRDLTPQNAMSAVFGYTIVNDVTARDAQRDHGQWFKGKGLDTSCPMGPCIVTAEEFGDPAGHRIWLTVNGETRQDSNTADMLFNVVDILVSLSAGLTLEPGDVIATGTPSGVGMGMKPQQFLKRGDVIVAGIEGIGELRNRVA
jgi:2-keto-4-pentenoate hydratase/2-oxohepta-3-ene-1,7-dioic acid hydratase in catechol pathway